MGAFQSMIDISGDWSLGARRANAVLIGVGGALTIDNTTTPSPTISINGAPLRAGYCGATASMPPDNPAPTADGAAIDFPSSTFLNVGTAAVPLGTTQFQLNLPGMYEVAWQVSVTGQAQLGLALVSGSLGEGPPGLIARTVAGQAQGICQVSGCNLLNVVTAPAVIELRNCTGGDITLTPYAGDVTGTTPVSASITIVKTS